MNILCIDGGGIRGVFPAHILMKLEEETHYRVNELFDMVAGSSTGAIIAASVAVGKEMKEVHQFYRQYAHHIFQKRSILGLFQSVYDNNALKELLKKELGEITLGDVPFPLSIPAVDISQGSAHTFRSHRFPVADQRLDEHSPRDYSARDSHPVRDFASPGSATMVDADTYLWDAVLSSCSAPYFFPPNHVQQAYLAVDGGLWANNPSFIGLTEGINRFGKRLDQIKMVSIGTGKQHIQFHARKEKRWWGLTRWWPIQLFPFRTTPKLIDLALHLSAESIAYHCQLLCKEQYLRINTDLGKEIPFDDARYMGELTLMAETEYARQSRELLSFLGIE